MHMVGYGSFADCWQSCFGNYASHDPIEQQIVEISTMVGYGLRGPGMTADDNVLSNLDQGDMSVVAYYQICDYWYPLSVRSVMEGEQGSLSDMVVSFLVGAQCVPFLSDVVATGLWPLYSPR